jgi:hypothetical protein
MATLKDVVAQLQEQNKELSAVNANIASMLKADLDRAKSEKIKMLDEIAEKRKEANRRASGLGPKGLKAGFVSGIKEASGFNLLDRMLGGIFGGGTVGALLGLFGKALGRGLVFGGAALLFEKFAKQITDGAISILSNILPETWTKYLAENSESIATSMSEAVNWGAIGLVFGKKFGLAMFGGKLIGDLMTNALGINADGTFVQETIDKILGIDIPISDGFFMEVAGVFAMLFAPSLIRAVMTGALFVGGKAAAGGAMILKDGFKKQIQGGFLTKLKGVRGGVGAGLGLTIIGQVLGEGITAFTGSEEFGSTIGNAVSIAGLFAMGGPYGVLIGAIVGVAYAGFNIISDLLAKRRARLAKELNEELIGYRSDFGYALALGDTTAARTALDNYIKEAGRIQDPDTSKMAQETITAMANQLGMLSGEVVDVSTEVKALGAAQTFFKERSGEESILAQAMIGSDAGVGGFKDVLTKRAIAKAMEDLGYGGMELSELEPEEFENLKDYIRTGMSRNADLYNELVRTAKQLGIKDTIGFQSQIFDELAMTAATSGQITSEQIRNILNKAERDFGGTKAVAESLQDIPLSELNSLSGTNGGVQVNNVDNSVINQQTQNMGLATNTSTPAVDTMMGGISLSRYRAGAFGF